MALHIKEFFHILELLTLPIHLVAEIMNIIFKILLLLILYIVLRRIMTIL